MNGKIVLRPLAPPEEIKITTEFIRLEALFKLAAAVGTGGEAKARIQNGEARVNGEVCTQRGRKLRPGDTAQLGAQSWRVV